MILLIVILVVVVVVLSSATLTTVRLRRRRRPARLGATRTTSPRTEAPTVSTIAPDGRGAGASEERREKMAPERGGDGGPPRLLDRLGRARQGFSSHLSQLRGRSVDAASFDELEEALILADTGMATTTALVEAVRASLGDGVIGSSPEALLTALGEEVAALFDDDEIELRRARSGPTLWLFVGVNGVGKTTTIGKLAAQATKSGERVVLAAGDTYRAAAAEQLEQWAQRSGAALVRGAEGADPASVIFDAAEHAAARGASLLLADTAGRLHTKSNLMDELRKVRRVADRSAAECTEVLLVLDATTGQNGLVQARQFAEAVAVTGIVLTKLDGTAKGGIVCAVRRELGIPVKLVGVGEGPEDLVPFDSDEFVAALFGS